MLKNNYVKWVYGGKVIDHIDDIPKGSLVLGLYVVIEKAIFNKMYN